MKEWFITWLLILVIGVTTVPVGMVMAGISVNEWLLFAGHLGSMVVGMVIIFIAMVERRDALREEHMNGASGTRHAADIYFQLRQKHNLAREESLVEYVDTLKAENVAIKQAAKEVIAYWAAAEKGQMEYAMDQSIPALRDACGFTEKINTLLSEDSGKEKAYGRK